MTTTTEAPAGAQPDPWAAYDGLTVDITDSPAIAADTQTFAGYLRDQAGYYRSLDSEYADKLAELISAHATLIEFADRSQAVRERLAIGE